MRISLNWLKEFVDIPVDPDTLADDLTMLGLEIETIDRPGQGIHDVVVGKILSINAHPDADKLVVCKTDVGEGEPLQIVCGAKNMKAGDHVPTAKVGAELAGGFAIARRKMRGIESFGMMCSAQELGMGEDHSGLLILNKNAPVGADIIPILGLDDVIYEIEVTPNRNDWASMIGVARELAALYHKPYRKKEISIEESGEAAARISSVSIEAPEHCPRYAGRILTNITIGPSPQWLCQRLIAAGQRPINNVVDITNFVLLETGHPLHAFDYDRLGEHRIVVRLARPGETMRTLDGEDRNLHPEMLVIADAREAVALAGIMGGEDSEVGEKTTRVFLESAYFSPTSIRRTARALGMMTEASQRFQRGADPVMLRYALDRAAQLMQELAGAQVAPGVLDEYPKPLSNNVITLRYSRTNHLLGTDVEDAMQCDILTRLGFEAQEADPGKCAFGVPSWRHDCTQEVDLIEEVARLNGYDQTPVTLPQVRPVEHTFAPEEVKVRFLRKQLVTKGLTEVMNMTFTSPQEVRKAGLSDEYLDMVALQNPLSENHATMRTSLLPGLLANVSANVRHGSPDVRIFEIGPVYYPQPKADLPRQETRLAVALSGYTADNHWSVAQRLTGFHDIKGILEAVLDGFGLQATFEPGDLATLRSGACARVLVGDAHIGWIGQVAGDITQVYDIQEHTCVFEVDLGSLVGAPTPVNRFQPIPVFPPSLRDMALVVDASVPAGALRDTALAAGGKLLKRVDIFDIYQGPQIPPERRASPSG